MRLITSEEHHSLLSVREIPERVQVALCVEQRLYPEHIRTQERLCKTPELSEEPGEGKPVEKNWKTRWRRLVMQGSVGRSTVLGSCARHFSLEDSEIGS